MTDSVTVSTLIAVASLVSEIRLAMDGRTDRQTLGLVYVNLFMRTQGPIGYPLGQSVLAASRREHTKPGSNLYYCHYYDIVVALVMICRARCHLSDDGMTLIKGTLVQPPAFYELTGLIALLTSNLPAATAPRLTHSFQTCL